MTTTTKFQVKPDYYTCEKDLKEGEKKTINTNPRYKFFCQTHFTAGDIDQFQQYRDPSNGSIDIPQHRQHSTIFPIPKQVQWSKYQDLDVSAVDNTFKYLFYKFKKCIFLKVKEGKLSVFLPFSNKNFVNEWSDRIKIDPSFTDLNDFMKHITTLEGYKFSPHKINKFIDSWYSNNCLIRSEFPIYEGDTNVPNASDMFHTLCRERKIPDIEFFVNRRDFPLLKTNETEPYSHLYDTSNMKLLSHNYSKYCPILSMVTTDNFADIPIPTGDDWALVSAPEGKLFPHNSTRVSTEPLNTICWENKKSIAVFRGSSTGAGVTVQTNMRLKLAHLSVITPKDSDNLPLLDAGITKWNLRPRKIKGEKYLKTIDIKNLPFGLSTFLSPEEQYSYKYVINVDGHVSSYRLSRELDSGCCLLLVASKYKLWYRHMLKPFEHYVPVRSDLSDLIDKIKWCKNHDEQCKQIAQNAKQFYKTYINKDGILDYLQQLLISLKKSNGIYFYNQITPQQVLLKEEVKIVNSTPPQLSILTFLQNAKKTKDIFTNPNTSIVEYNFEGKLFVQKKSTNVVHEAFISLKTNNLPNFVHNYGLYDDFIILESVKGQTFSQYIKSDYFTMKDFTIILLQLSIAIYTAQEKFSFVHNDLTPWNIIIKILPSPITVEYKFDKIHYNFKTNIIPIIIDLGRSHIVHESKHYGNINMFSSSTIQDIVTILVTSISDICNFELNKNDSSTIVTIANFLSGTQYCPKSFSTDNMGSLKLFFNKASKYTELISSDKHELENRNPIHFANYLLSSFKIRDVNIVKTVTVEKSFTLWIDETIFLHPDKVLLLLEDEKVPPVTKESVKYIAKTIYSENLKYISSLICKDKIIDKYMKLYRNF